MPKSKEFTIQLDDRPGTLAKCCRAFAERRINILAFEAFSREGQSIIRLVVDDPTSAKSALDAQQIYCTEAEVVQVALPHRSGELFRAASLLGEAGININYAYCGMEPRTNSPLVIFGVKEVGKAATILDEIAQKAA
jgi:hypothetical protein